MSNTPPLDSPGPERSEPVLFEPSPDSGLSNQATPPPEGVGRPRVQRANRLQVTFRAVALDQLLPPDHAARAVWAYVEGMGLSDLYHDIRAVERHPGRPPIDPMILMTLWLYATVEGVGSARELDRLCKDHVAYQWICGDVSVNYHTLADFRTEHADLLDRLISQSVATLMHQGLVDLKRVAQDGMRVRASAGSSSFRRRVSLEKCLAEAEAQVTALKDELEADPGAATKRQQAARERAAREQAERVGEALKELAKLEPKMEARKKGSQEKARASTTDPDARRMKMADGGFRPAYNVEFATDVASQVIVGVDVVNAGSDGGQMLPMVEQIEARYQQTPEEYLVDGGFATVDDIEAVGGPDRGTTIYTPVKDEEKKQKAGVDPFAPRPRDSEPVAAWRARMGTEEAKEIYKDRAATAECVNAQARNRGLQQFRVRGLLKARAVALWYALAHNIMRSVALVRAAAAATTPVLA
jgi:transposase